MISGQPASKCIPGAVLGHYRIIGEIGAGGMGIVYKCLDARLDRLVALKVLPAEAVADTERRRRFAQEAKAASALNHPNIITVYDIGSAEGFEFIAMEYVEGRTLDKTIGRHGIPLKRALVYAVQMADALGKAHAAGIIHRDLKPSNIMITNEDQVKILDFGLAKLTATSRSAETGSTLSTLETFTRKGELLGTPAYMAPEQVEGKGVDARSDIFSFGSVLYQMLTGHPPFRGETAMASMMAILREEPTPLSQIRPEIPGKVERALMRCLRKEPQQRWQGMHDLKLLLQDLQEEADSDERTAVASAPIRKKRQWLWGMSVLVVVVVAATIGWQLYRRQAASTLPEVTRITFEPRLAFSPAISPDGKLLAFTSEREGNYQIYVQQINGRQLVRLTHSEAMNFDPTFSPDGAHVAFSSLRDGGGIYEVDTLGGTSRKIVDGGRSPHYSPDGTVMAYLVVSSFSQTAKIFLVSRDGTSPRPFHPEFEVPSVAIWNPPPLWSPDGKYLLFDGARDGNWKNENWWMAPIEGGPPIAVGMPPMRTTSAFQLMAAWAGNYVYYSEGTTIGGFNLFRVPLEKDPWRIAGAPQRLTSGSGMQWWASVANDGRLVFASTTALSSFWSIPLHAKQGTVAGDLQELSADTASKGSLSVAADGSKLAYAAALRFPVTMELRVRDLVSGREQLIPITGKTLNLLPRLNADGSRIAYRDLEGSKRVSYVADISGENRIRVCENCWILDFSPHADAVLVSTAEGLLRLELANGSRSPLIQLPPDDINDAVLAPDGKRLVFVGKNQNGNAVLYTAAIRDKALPAQEWVAIAEDSARLTSPRWSRDGNILYYISTRDGNVCAWAQRIERNGKPVADPFPAFHSHHVPGLWPWPDAALGVTPDRLYLLLGDTRGDIWTTMLDHQ